MQTQVVKLSVLDGADGLVARAVDLFASRWRERSRVRLVTGSDAGVIPDWELTVGLADQPEFQAAVKAAGLELPDKPQSYALAALGRKLTLCAKDGHGVLYGLGNLLRVLPFEENRVNLPDIRLGRAPAVYNRGVYFATHFNNYYEAAPVERVERYIEEMALAGFDLWMFWFDINWFPHGFWRDPKSRGMRMANRLRRFCEKARACGLKVVAGGIGNEGFAYQPPPALRADMSARHGGFYQFSQICPSKAGGLAMILENRRQVMRLLGPLDAYIHWPYDQGGCGCARCTHAPGRWGRKFLEIGPQIAAVVRQANPGIQFWVSTWLMDETEREMVYAVCDAKADWLQGIVSQVDYMGEHPLDARYARVTFPEISMFDCYFCSYGCNGANPAPRRMAEEAARVARAGWGTALYSEGIYTDLNKAVYVERLWDPARDIRAILAEYARYHFGAANIVMATELISGLETTWGAQALLKADRKTVDRLLSLARRLKTHLPHHRDAADRWRMLHDRAAMDQLMKAAGPERALAAELLALFNDMGYLPAAGLRRRVKRLVGELRRRKRLVDRLMDAHWRYMRYFHMENNVMIFLPDDVLGRRAWESLIAPLARAAALRDETAMRRAVSRAFKRAFWFNGIDYKFLFQ